MPISIRERNKLIKFVPYKLKVYLLFAGLFRWNIVTVLNKNIIDLENFYNKKLRSGADKDLLLKKAFALRTRLTLYTLRDFYLLNNTYQMYSISEMIRDVHGKVISPLSLLAVLKKEIVRSYEEIQEITWLIRTTDYARLPVDHMTYALDSLERIIKDYEEENNKC